MLGSITIRTIRRSWTRRASLAWVMTKLTQFCGWVKILCYAVAPATSITRPELGLITGCALICSGPYNTRFTRIITIWTQWDSAIKVFVEANTLIGERFPSSVIGRIARWTSYCCNTASQATIIAEGTAFCHWIVLNVSIPTVAHVWAIFEST